jgi:hypothetical protein
MPRPLFTVGKDTVRIVQEAGCAPGPVWTGAENLPPPPGFDPQIVQPLAQSLYLLSYSGPLAVFTTCVVLCKRTSL